MGNYAFVCYLSIDPATISMAELLLIMVVYIFVKADSQVARSVLRAERQPGHFIALI
jgi:hypothetical protein